MRAGLHGKQTYVYNAYFAPFKTEILILSWPDSKRNAAKNGNLVKDIQDCQKWLKNKMRKDNRSYKQN